MNVLPASTGEDFIGDGTLDAVSDAEVLDIGRPDVVDFFGMWDDLIGVIVQREARIPDDEIEPVLPRKMIASINGLDRIVVFRPEYRTEGGIVGTVDGVNGPEALKISFDPETEQLDFEIIAPTEEPTT